MTSQTQLCRYTYDPLDRLASSAQSGQPISQCFYQAGQLQGEVQGLANRLLMRHGDQLLAQRAQREGVIDQQLLGSDRQHSVLSANGRQLQQAMAYSPYGHRPVDSALTQLPGFAGERLDPVTGHYMLGNGYRSFNPLLMRFNSPDSFSPFGEGGFNAYAYCLGDPVNYRDPDGHMPWWAGLVAGAVATLLTAGVASIVTAAVGVSAATAATVGATAAKVAIVAGGVSVNAAVGSAVTSGGLSEALGWLSLGSGIAAGVSGGVAIGVKLGALASRITSRSVSMSSIASPEQQALGELQAAQAQAPQAQRFVNYQDAQRALNNAQDDIRAIPARLDAIREAPPPYQLPGPGYISNGSPRPSGDGLPSYNWATRSVRETTP